MDTPPKLSPQDVLWIAGIVRAIGRNGKMSLTAAQNRNADEMYPSWTLRIDGEVEGAALAIENDGPELDVLLEMPSVYSEAWDSPSNSSRA